MTWKTATFNSWKCALELLSDAVLLFHKIDGRFEIEYLNKAATSILQSNEKAIEEKILPHLRRCEMTKQVQNDSS